MKNFKEFTTGHFIVGDEVYLVNGDGEPFGMVVKIGDRNIHIKPHDANNIVVKKPTELYLGKEWHEFNKNNFYGLFSRTKRTKTNIVVDSNTINNLILNDMF